MKIPLKFINNRIIVNISLTARSYRILYKPVAFVIDTGSPKSFLCQNEAFRLQIPTNRLTSIEVFSMGGFKYNFLELKGFLFNVKTEDEKLYAIKLKKFGIAMSTKKSDQALTESRGFPSILGTDFFEENNLFLHFDPKNKEVYIGIAEEKKDKFIL